MRNQSLLYKGEKGLKTLFFLLFSFFFLGSISAHKGTIKGIALDAETGVGLIGAHVKLLEKEEITYTDELGFFSFSNLEKGKYTVEISYLGFESQQGTAEVTDTETTSLRISLMPSDIDLAAVEVQARPDDNFRTISQLDIKTRPVNTSQDILRIVPGLVIAQHAGGGKAEQIFLRGFDIDHGTDISISVDGMPVNMVSHAHGQGYADLHFLIPELVQGVDFAKGNYDAKVGNFATAGNVQFHTPTALSQSMVKIEGGQFDTWRGVAMLDLLGESAKQRGQNAWVASEYNFSDGYFDSPQNFTRFNVMGKYTGVIDENQSISLSFSSFTSRWDHSGQIPERSVADGSITRFGAIDDTEGGETSRQNINLVFLKNLGNRTFLKQQLFYSKYDFELFSNFTFFLDDPVNGDQIRQHESRQIIGYNGSWNQEIKLAGINFNTTIGAQLRYDEVDGVELSKTLNRTETLSQLAYGDVTEANVGFFIEETAQLSPRWSVNAGLRYDQFLFNYNDLLTAEYDRTAETKGLLQPKLNLTFDASKKIRLFAQSGIGFHSNDSRVAIAQAGEEILPKAYGIEFGTILKPTSRLLINASVWRLDLDQEFVYVGDAGIVEPSGRTKRQGIDFSARYQILDWLFADADFNWTLPRAKDEANGEDYIPLAPTRTSIGGLTAQSKTGIFGSLRYRYIGDRAANEDNSVTAEGQFVVDGLLGYRRQKFEVSISVQNIFDTEYNDAQFLTESRLATELEPVEEIHFTPGMPFFVKGGVSVFF